MYLLVTIFLLCLILFLYPPLSQICFLSVYFCLFIFFFCLPLFPFLFQQKSEWPPIFCLIGVPISDALIREQWKSVNKKRLREKIEKLVQHQFFSILWLFCLQAKKVLNGQLTDSEWSTHLRITNFKMFQFWIKDNKNNNRQHITKKLF